MEVRLINKCPECGSKNLITDYDSGEIVCGDCGLVLDSMINEGPEWRAYNLEEETERSRAGMPETLSFYDKGLSTTLEPITHDASGRTLSSDTYYQMRRLSKHQQHSRIYLTGAQNLARAMTELNRLSDTLNIPSKSKSPVRERAAAIYRKILKKGLIRGRSINGMISAALYAACRETGILRTLQEVADASLVDKKLIGRCYRLIIKELDKKMPIVDPIDCVSKIAKKIGISEKTQGLAVQILRQAKATKKIHSGKDPRSLAAAALYIACRKNNEQKKGGFGISTGDITQRDIAEAAEITEVTVRNRYKDLEKLPGI